jgi:hypothetical protein
MVKGADFLIGKRNLPQSRRLYSGKYTKGIDWYYLYYGTLTTFQMGKHYWGAWNPRLKKLLLPSQCKGGDKDGSWDPAGPWNGGAPICGRAWSTAVGALCLEVYYRYLPIHSK